jgi:uncharacterized protein (DUF1810 family)
MTGGSDRYELGRFVEAQRGCFEQVCGELRAGRKRSHWMWFIFPQVQGLGLSPMAVRYGISSKDEAEAYLNHEILAPRLLQCTELVMLVEGRTIEEIFGRPDDLKFRSSMTLFATVSTDHAIFQQALEKYFAGEPDRLTLERLGALS